VKKGLDAEHYAVDVSSDGEQARAIAGEFDYDLLVLDLSMPRLDGVAILRYLRTRKPSMPIIVLTGRTKVEDWVECLDLGADDYLGKPFSFSELSARIRALLRRCHLPAESVLTVDDLKLDRVERKVAPLRLTAKANNRTDCRNSWDRDGNDRLGKNARNYRECVLKMVNAAVISGYRDRASTV
jgi:DNA-binding response OmpR family regulator